jgi:tetratricopeptide (TPR) repeat protein
MASSARIEELEKKFNENPRRYFAPLANEYRKAGDVQQAIAICRTYVPQQPGHMSGHIVFGQALFEAGDHDEARGVFEAALGLDPENLIALRHLGDIAREHGEAGDARAWYRRVLDADPRNDEVAALLTSVEAEQAAQAADAPATWTEINPEQTLELPPDVLAAVPRDIGFAGGTQSRSPASPASSMGELFDGSADETPAPDAPGAATLEFRSPSYAAPEGAGYVDEAARTVPTFVTETMAELYVQQGFYDRALSVYRQLLTQHPGDPKLAERMEQLRRESAATPPRPVMDSPFDVASAIHSAPDHRSVREFFNELALRQPRVRAEPPAEVAPASASQAAGEQEESAVGANEPAVVPDASDVAVVSASAPVAAAEASEPAVAAEAPRETAEAAAQAPHHEESPVAPPITTPGAPPAADVGAEVGQDDIKHLPHDLDMGLSDTSYHETYSAEFGASALAVPDDTEDDEHTGRALFEGGGAGTDSFIVRPSSEADPFALFGFSAANEASEFDVTAFEGSTVHASPGEPAAGSQEPAPDHSDPVVAGDAATPSQDEAAPVGSSGADDASGGAESAPAPSGEAARRAAMQTGSVNVLFPERPVSAPDEAAAAALSSAFGGPSFQPELDPARTAVGKAEAKAGNAEAKGDVSGSGGSARPALNELSLDSVFRESPAAAPDPRREPSAFSFDQFFGETPQATAPGSASGTDSVLGDSLDVGSADAEQFSNWLSGLKKK